MVKEKFNLTVSEVEQLLPFQIFNHGRRLYMIGDVTGMKDETIKELYLLATHLQSLHDQHVFSFLPSNEATVVINWENRNYCLLGSFPQVVQMDENILAYSLAQLHYRGKLVQDRIRKISRVGQWKQLWERRLEQLENVWNSRLSQLPENDFERMFLESFPYYMGVTENAIQYLVNTEIDDQPHYSDLGTVCHKKFTKQLWEKSYFIKNPFDWVFDHCSRDLAEWTRSCYFKQRQTYAPIVQKFFRNYQYGEQLSSFSWRLIFSRLLFPLHYFECIENYYITTSEHDKRVAEQSLSLILRHTNDYERFLAQFYEIAEAPRQTYGLPTVEWLYSNN